MSHDRVHDLQPHPVPVQLESNFQIQGKLFLDFFLFDPDNDDDPFANEMPLVTTLVALGKERFLLHPIFVVFLKIKW